MVGGKIVYANEPFAKLAPPPLPVSPDWSPVKQYGGYFRSPSAHAGAKLAIRQSTPANHVSYLASAPLVGFRLRLLRILKEDGTMTAAIIGLASRVGHRCRMPVLRHSVAGAAAPDWRVPAARNDCWALSPPIISCRQGKTLWR